MMTTDEIVRELRQLAENSRIKRDVLIAAADLIEELQRREQAAVEDMKHGDNCDVCVGSGIEPDSCGCECMTCTLDCRCHDCRDESKFEWRGPQEAGQGGPK